MKIKAHAKINLRLKVVGMNEQKYHLLQMVNAKICLHDTIIIKKLKQPKVVIDMLEIKQEDNIVYKVVENMFKTYLLPGGIYIKIKKKIPFGAGLAGGSTDAASIILAINKIYKLNLSKDQLQKEALKCGTDIVYCLENDICLVEGIGEQVQEFRKEVKQDILLINPNIVVSTKEIYELYDETKDYSKPLNLNQLQNLSYCDLLQNDLEKIVFEKYPIIKDLKEEIAKETKCPILMSGSGSTLFIMGKRKELKRWGKIYRKKYPKYQIHLTSIK